MEPSTSSPDKSAVLDFFMTRTGMVPAYALHEVDPEDVVMELKAITGKEFKPGLLLITYKETRPPKPPRQLTFNWINFTMQDFPSYPAEKDLEVALFRVLKLRDVWRVDEIKIVLGESKITEPLHVIWKGHMPKIWVSYFLVNDKDIYQLNKFYNFDDKSIVIT